LAAAPERPLAVARIVIAVVSLLALFAAPARAATTVFGASVFSTSGSVLNAPNALGAADGSSAQINRLGVLVLSLGAPATGANLTINGVRLTAGSVVQISVGEVVGGTAIFTAAQTFPGGFGTSATFDFSAGCALIASSGCSLLRVRVAGPPGSAFFLDGGSALSAAPEPQAWALMMLGFAGVAARLKSLRRRRPQFAPA
jgi:hypothetical protein